MEGQQHEVLEDTHEMTTKPSSPLSLESKESTDTTLEELVSSLSSDDEEEQAMKPPSLPVVSTLALCLCTFTNSYLLISVFPYSGFMAIELLHNVNEENAGSVAGFIASSFMLGRTLSSFHWGKAADSYGRVTVLCTSLALSCIFTLLFGISRSFASAILFRGLLGMSNGIIGTAKTIVSEQAHGNEDVEAKSMAIVMGMWGFSFLISPAVSGALAEPVRQYPTAAWVQQFKVVLTKFPFLLPNVIGAVLCIVSFIAIKLCVQETLPKEKRKSLVGDCKRATCLCRQWKRLHTNDDDEEDEVILPIKHVQKDVAASFCKRIPETSEGCVMKEEWQSNEATMASLWSRPDTRIHLIVYWIFSFVMSSLEESFPLFCISKQGGLGLSESGIGRILSGSGLIFAPCQYFVYTFIVNRYGMYGSIKIGSVLVVPLIWLIPFSRFFQQDDNGQASLGAFVYLSIGMAVLRVFALVFFYSITVTTNKTVPLHCRATMNGLSMLGGSLTKGIGPVFAGYLAAFSFSSSVIPAQVGGFVVFGTLGLFACIVAVLSTSGVLERSLSIKYEPCLEKEGAEEQ